MPADARYQLTCASQSWWWHTGMPFRYTSQTHTAAMMQAVHQEGQLPVWHAGCLLTRETLPLKNAGCPLTHEPLPFKHAGCPLTHQMLPIKHAHCLLTHELLPCKHASYVSGTYSCHLNVQRCMSNMSKAADHTKGCNCICTGYSFSVEHVVAASADSLLILMPCTLQCLPAKVM